MSAGSMLDMGVADDLRVRADTLADLERVTREHAERPQLIAAARSAGATWPEIAASLSMSVTAARKLHAKLEG